MCYEQNKVIPILVRGNVCLLTQTYEIKNMDGLQRLNYGLLTKFKPEFNVESCDIAMDLSATAIL